MSKKNSGSGVLGGVIFGIILVFALIMIMICTTRVPVGYEAVVCDNMNGGVQNETLSTGWHLVSPTKKVKMFTVSNEQLILTRDKREGSKDDESFRVASADNASIAISFQMSYRYKPETLVDTYKKFKGMNGEDIVTNRVQTVLKSRVSEVTTDYSLMELYSGNRAEINEKITNYLNEEFGKQFGLEVIDASIIDVHPNKQLKNAINKRIEAQQKADQAKAEQETAKVQAETEKINAQKDADIKVIKAQADADAILAKADAEAEANRKINESLTGNILKQKYIEKWDGKLPTVQGSSNSILDLGDVVSD